MVGRRSSDDRAGGHMSLEVPGGNSGMGLPGSNDPVP